MGTLRRPLPTQCNQNFPPPAVGELHLSYETRRLATALAGFLIGNTIHGINHAADLDLGGHA